MTGPPTLIHCPPRPRRATRVARGRRRCGPRGWGAGREGCVNIRNGQDRVEGRSGNRADIPGATTPHTPWGGKTRRGSSVAEHRWWQGQNLALPAAAAAARRVGTPLPPSCGPGPRIGARGTRPEMGGGKHGRSPNAFLGSFLLFFVFLACPLAVYLSRYSKSTNRS